MGRLDWPFLEPQGMTMPTIGGGTLVSCFEPDARAMMLRNVARERSATEVDGQRNSKEG